ncbi:MAG: type II toxin-antitoxin system VapC family toxin [Solirubrobacteraceae bacterium]
MIVVDASVMTDYLLRRPPAVEAVAEILAGDDTEPLHAPDLIEPEIMNALRQMTTRGAVTVEQASEAVLDLAETRIIRYQHPPLRARVWELRDQLTAYDAMYLALAEGLQARLLLTADRGLAARAGASLGEDRVRHLRV